MKKLSAKQLNALQREIEELRKDIEAKLGADDVDHLETIQQLSRYCEIAGRLLIHFSLEPVSWSVGVASLATHYLLDTAELGHNVLHKQYDVLDDPRFHSSSFRWEFPVDEKQWMKEHNTMHHVFTNIVGKDPDLTYATYRMNDKTPWHPLYLLQPLTLVFSALNFGDAIGLYVSGMLDLKFGKGKRLVAKDKSTLGTIKDAAAYLSKWARRSAKEFVFYPTLGGIFAPKILAGNLAASTLRSLYLCAVIFTGHFTERAIPFTQEQVTNETKGGWYARQLQAAGNFRAGTVFSNLAGHLNYQIEHHLFPTMPAWRYPQVADKVREICRRYGIPYNTGSFASQMTGVLKRVMKYAAPPKKAKRTAGASKRGKVIPLKRSVA